MAEWRKARIRTNPAFVDYFNMILPKLGSQNEIAEKLGIHHAAVSSWKLGRSLPAPENVVQLVEKFDLDPEEVYSIAFGRASAVMAGLLPPDRPSAAGDGDEIHRPDLSDWFRSHTSETALNGSYGSRRATGKKLLPVLGSIPCGEQLDLLATAAPDIEWVEATAAEFARGRYFLRPIGDSMQPEVDPGRDLLCMQHLNPAFVLPALPRRGRPARMAPHAKRWLARMHNRIVAAAVNPVGPRPEVTLKRLEFYDLEPKRPQSRRFTIILSADNLAWRSPDPAWQGNRRVILPSDELAVYAVAVGLRRFYGGR